MLTGMEIKNQIVQGRMSIHPYREEAVGVNSYDVRLAPCLFRLMGRSDESATLADMHVLDLNKPVLFERVDIPSEGYVLHPGEAYLGVTVEWTHTPYHIPNYEGRSTMARYFISSHSTAGFGDIGYRGHWTLEITCQLPVKIYPNIRIGQLSFHEPTGKVGDQYEGSYGNVIEPNQTTGPQPQLPRPRNY